MSTVRILQSWENEGAWLLNTYHENIHKKKNNIIYLFQKITAKQSKRRMLITDKHRHVRLLVWEMLHLVPWNAMCRAQQSKGRLLAGGKNARGMGSFRPTLSHSALHGSLGPSDILHCAAEPFSVGSIRSLASIKILINVNWRQVLQGASMNVGENLRIYTKFLLLSLSNQTAQL